MNENIKDRNNLRLKLMKAAVDIISRQGIVNVTMRALSQELKVSRTAAYRHFKNKNALLCAIAQEGFHKLTQSYRAINKDNSMDVLSKFRKIGITYILFALENPGYYRLMFGNEIIRQKRSPELLAAAKETFDEFLFCIDLCKKKLKLKSINTLSYANIAWASVHGLSTLLIDGQIKVTDKTGGMPALFTKNEIQDSENIRKFIHSSIKILIDFMKSNKS